MTSSPTELEGLVRIEPHAHEDSRGGFVRLFNALDMGSLFGGREVRQVNLSMNSAKGTLRGLHYQLPPYCEAKMVMCVKGAVYDVAVDLRAGSPTFLRWHAEELSRDNRRILFLPEGFAHGFMSLKPDSEIVYLHSGDYRPEHEAGVRYDDPRLSVIWPGEPAVLSPRDKSFPLLEDGFTGVAP